MDKEEALKEARRLLKKSGVDTSEMTDAEMLAKIEERWEILKPELERLIEGICKALSPIVAFYIAWMNEWWESLPEEVRAELKGEP